jgi:predicted MFS family arabinose efflux permease
MPEPPPPPDDENRPALSWLLFGIGLLLGGLLRRRLRGRRRRRAVHVVYVRLWHVVILLNSG